MKKMFAAVLALIMALSMCAAFAETTEEVASDKQYVIDKGVLVVGITDFAPMDYKDENGEWIGFDADVAKAFAAKLGVEVEFVEIDWDNKILELDSKAVDCIWNGMTLTDAVLAAMECSNPYMNNAQVVVVPADKAEQYQTVESLADLAFAAEAGSAGEAELLALNLNCTPVSAQADALMEVAAGTSDAAVIDALMAAAMIGEGTNYENLTYTIGLNSEEYGVGFRRDSDLAAELNAFLYDTYNDGSLIAIAETYLVQAALIDQSASDKQYVINKGALVVGITDFAPMDYKDENGEWIGFDADVAKAFAADLGIAVEFVEIDWDNKILELDSKAVDCIWNGMTLTDAVLAAMECSNPYMNNAQVVVVPADKAEQYQTIESLADLSFAAEAGSAGEAELLALNLNCTPVSAQADALMEVAAGTSDAAVIDALMAAAMIGEGTNYENLTYTIGLNSEEYGVGFRVGSDLAEALNAFLLETYNDGSLIATAETYLVQAALINQAELAAAEAAE